MRRLRRWTLNTLTVLSLGMCLATVGLWVRSRSIEEHISWCAPEDCRAIESRLGEVSLIHDHIIGIDPIIGFYVHYEKGFHRYSAAIDSTMEWKRLWGAPGWHRAGFGIVHRKGHGVEQWRISLPHSAIAIASGLGPGTWLVLRIRRRRATSRAIHRGLCPHCGYDLRATPDCCPECGAAVKGAAT